MSSSTITSYTLGQQLALSVTVANQAGTPTDATIALTVRTPDGVETDESASVVHDSTGNYHADYTTMQHGLHAVRWVASGALVAAQEMVFYVLRSEF